MEFPLEFLHSVSDAGFALGRPKLHLSNYAEKKDTHFPWPPIDTWRPSTIARSVTVPQLLRYHQMDGCRRTRAALRRAEYPKPEVDSCSATAAQWLSVALRGRWCSSSGCWEFYFVLQACSEKLTAERAASLISTVFTEEEKVSHSSCASGRSIPSNLPWASCGIPQTSACQSSVTSQTR